MKPESETSKSTYGERVNRHLLLLITFLLCVAIGLQGYYFKQQAYFHDEARLGREQILVLEKHNEAALNDHMMRTVERWSYLQQKNPSLRVVPIPEPIQPEPLHR
jgi:hypothetical protein